MKKTVIITIIVLVVAGGGYFLFRGGYQIPGYGQPTPSQQVAPATTVPTPASTQEAVKVKEVSMTSGNTFFNPKDITLAKGEPVKITFQNTGRHTFTIDELGVNASLSGSSPTVEFTPTKAGAFEYYCAVPGHREGGMLGSLTVE